MGAIDLSILAAPVAEAEPCGADLDAAGDSAYLAFMAAVEGRLPESYAGFDPASMDFPASFESAAGLLGRTRDVRLLVLLAKLLILSRDLGGFVATVSTIHRLLAEQWDDVHPRGEDGDYAFRMAPLYTLDDNGPVLQPLQHVPLAESTRFGAVTYRAHQLMTGQARPREGETVDASMFERATTDCDLSALVASRDALVSLKTALAGIRNAATEKAGYEQAVRLEKLPPIVDGMIAFVDELVGRRDPSQALESKAATAEPSSGDGAEALDQGGAETLPATGIASQADAAAALEACLDYFLRFEPSSPAILLVRQARESVGRNLYEVMAMLAPAVADAARIQVGAEPGLVLPVKNLAGVKPPPPEATAQPQPPITSRRSALALLERVSSHYRTAEPSSPIPFLIDRARSLSSRDFLGLLKDLVPEAPPKK